MIKPYFKSVTAFAPATVANVGPGFDVFGLALSEPGDCVTVSLSNQSGVRIGEITGDDGKLPRRASKNTASVAISQFVEQLNIDRGLVVDIQKGLPLKSGLGSSAASSVAAIVAANHLFGQPLSKQEMLPFLIESERVACGSGHADNVAPCLYGGFVLVMDTPGQNSVKVIQVPVPKALTCVVIHPNIEISTRESRGVLPEKVDLKTSTRQGSNMAAMVAGFFLEDLTMIRYSLGDYLAEPYRSRLIPGYDQVKAAGAEHGTLGVGISGSGPSIFALCDAKTDTAQYVKNALAIFKAHGIAASAFYSNLEGTGTKVIKEIPL